MATIARDCGLADGEVQEVMLAVSEAASNAVVHGQDGGSGTIRVSARREHDELTIVVADDGTGFTPSRVSAGLGLGLPMIASVALRVEIVSAQSGAEVRMVFPCPGHGQAVV